jgi:hypothetical protein
MDITYEYRNLQVDAVRPRRRNPTPGILEGYLVTSDSASSDSDTSNDDLELEVEILEKTVGIEGLDWAELRAAARRAIGN